LTLVKTSGGGACRGQGGRPCGGQAGRGRKRGDGRLPSPRRAMR